MNFLNSASSGAALVFCLPGVCSACLVCVHTLTPRENRERLKSPEYFKIFEKNTIFNEHPVSFLLNGLGVPEAFLRAADRDPA